jgi:phage gp46-like protein
METEAKGILSPLRRDKKRDFASGSGGDLLTSKVRQALMTEGATPKSSGELPWRTAFGSALHLLRHQRNDAVLADLARVYVRDCLELWVPEVEVLEVEAVADGPALQLHVRFRASSGSGVSQVRLPIGAEERVLPSTATEPLSRGR